MTGAHSTDTVTECAVEGEQLAYLYQAFWRQLHEAGSPNAFSAAWITLQCSMLEGARAGVVVMRGSEQANFVPVASWPDPEVPSRELEVAADLVAGSGKGVVNRSGSFSCAALPLIVDDVLRGVAAVSIDTTDETELRNIMHQLQWGSGWLQAILRKFDTHKASDASLSVELAALIMEAGHFQEAATAVVTEIATRLGCDRVSLGIRDGRHSKVIALSHSAQFGENSNLTRAIGAAMDEAIDQHGSLRYPQAEGEKAKVDRAHADLAEVGGGKYIYTVPLLPAGDLFGAITLDSKQHDFNDELTASMDRIAAFIGPLLAARHREERWIGWKVWQSLETQLARLLGKGYVIRKLVLASLIAVVALFTQVSDTWRIQAGATLEGSVERASVAPIAGYIREAFVRAGDTVKAGDPLFRIDDRDLRLEYLKWSSQKEQVQRKLRDALAQHERSEVNVLRAQLDQAEAQLTMVGEQIARTRVTAPFDGVVVSGDLSDKLGAPVERGQVLFEVAPIDSYRIALQVNEKEISAIQPGQQGHLVLAAMPQQQLPFKVETITPVSNPEGGRNTFRVEAALVETPSFLRPGMQGKARIAIEERSLGWIWTHELLDWLRLWVWSWWP